MTEISTELHNARSRLSPIQGESLVQLAQNGIHHGFFTRQGGVSQGIYAGLNVGLGSEDDRDAVNQNRALVASWFGNAAGAEHDMALATVHQVHSPDVVHVTDAPDHDTRPKADAMVTATPGLVLGVLTADCGPVLFADGKNRVIGAAHAGWKGALYGVLENTIAAMEALGAERSEIRAVLGPSISGKAYEVGPEFVERFLNVDADYARFFTPSPRDNHAFFDLPSLTLMRLAKAGIRAENLGLCTYGDDQRFFSYRRTTHAQEKDYGRQISAIALAAI